MSDDKKIIMLITKLICDTNDNRISWKRKFLRKPKGLREYYFADYDDSYKLTFLVDNSISFFHLSLSDNNGTKLLNYTDSGLSDLYDVILAQAWGNSKLDEALEHILNS